MSRYAAHMLIIVAIVILGGTSLGVVLTRLLPSDAYGPLVLVVGLTAIALALLKPMYVLLEEREKSSKPEPHR